MAVWMIGWALSLWRQPRRHSFWIPAFAGKSGFCGLKAEPS
jgi:hypothetical protein